MINNLIIKKRKFLPLFLLLLTIFSCNSGYKKELEKRSNTILEELKSGNYSVIPGLSEKVDELDDSSKKQIGDSFSSMEFWEISVTDKKDDIVDVNINLNIDDVSKSMTLQFYYDNNEWVLSEKMVITQNINYVPSEIKKEAD